MDGLSRGWTPNIPSTSADEPCLDSAVAGWGRPGGPKHTWASSRFCRSCVRVSRRRDRVPSEGPRSKSPAAGLVPPCRRRLPGPRGFLLQTVCQFPYPVFLPAGQGAPLLHPTVQNDFDLPGDVGAAHGNDLLGREVEALADDLGVPLLGQLPLVPELREGGDTGNPITVANPTSELAQSFQAIAKRIATELKSKKIFSSALKVN